MLRHNAKNKKLSAAEWFRNGFGRWVAREENRLCRNMLADVFGLYAVQLGGSHATLNTSTVQHKALIGTVRADLRADSDALPFETDSLDLLIMVHTLESATAPHAALREAVRCVRPEGRLVIIGFNRWSLLSFSRSAPWRKRWLSPARINDWLTLLEMQPIAGEYAVFLPPWRNALQRRWRLRWLELAGRRWWPLAGGIFILHTVKRRHAMRLILPTSFKKPVEKAALASSSYQSQAARLPETSDA